jgi:hypothetical protein
VVPECVVEFAVEFVVETSETFLQVTPDGKGLLAMVAAPDNVKSAHYSLTAVSAKSPFPLSMREQTW